ncbi:hypothetical protein A2533_00390 [Candidatus Falkowbacteria bacterium RIFOXYD2_FULL_35_9]|uniref:Uncharacterized protein n=1 Tax=Candidatus Falkowbacteria bacterium RIFOXYC2_FULL_36_12 TaxID=1798002 RepID=A0A1F5T3T6_9BACT|nr:MAG: hypothetical protein A2300_01850 [Candidatus Falkowbacteria bacterium RIFOXYB2_FULL_35_7]OGF33403.1 MAG: hypothetical protein A2478_01745 [Candidatus Falkowbacteria bacterium RIFOXYC2_FULL_36_12]OGF46537.1 MAG: hypothetical protein A2533_00390 [Candidatus Falkowbacteria bacterium RIFOXYD2_FULL_35_9]
MAKNKKDLSLNQAYRDYLVEIGCMDNDGNFDEGKLSSFAVSLHSDKWGLKQIAMDVKGLGVRIQSKLYLLTKDKRFAPRSLDELRKLTELAPEFGEDPNQFNDLKNQIDRNINEFLPEFADNRVYVKILKKYRVGHAGGFIEKSALARYLSVSRSTLLYYETYKHPVNPENKMKLYLAFKEIELAPSNPREQGLLEHWAEIIKTLPFVETEKTDEDKTIESQPISMDRAEQIEEIKKQLLGDHEWLEKLKDALMLEEMTEKLSEVKVHDVPETEFVDEEFLVALEGSLRDATNRLQTISSLDKIKNQNALNEMTKVFAAFEDIVIDLVAKVQKISQGTIGARSAELLQDSLRLRGQFSGQPQRPKGGN